MHKIALAILLALAVVTSASAQSFSEGVQVTLVEVPVTVIDRDGKAVRNLTKDDFELYDDGKRVPVEYFDVIDMRQAAADRDALLPAAATRHFLLLFDFANSNITSLYHRARLAGKEFVQNQMGERDLAAVGIMTAESGVKMLTAFTRNKSLLLNAVETFGHPKYFRAADPLMISATRPEAAGVTQTDIDKAIAERDAEVNRLYGIGQDEQGRTMLKKQLDNLAGLARMLDGVSGQKQIIYFSEGFDGRLVQGEYKDPAYHTITADQVFNGEAYKVNSDDRFGGARSQKDLEKFGELFKRSDVVMHAVDVRGLRVGSDPRAVTNDARVSNDGLFLISRPTGGSLFHNENDMAANMARLFAQQEVVYLLGFTGKSSGKAGSFHELKVKAKGGRVSHRAGYYEGSANMSELQRTLTLAEIMTADIPMRDVHVSLAATPLPGPKGTSRVPVVVEMPGPKLLEGISGNAATANLYLYAFDANNEVADFMQQRIALDLTKAGDAVRGAGVRYFGTLQLPKGAYTIKALVRVDETGHTGFARASVDVPAFDAATVVPPVAFVDPANWVMLVAPARGGDEYAYPFAAGETKYIPQRPAAVSRDGQVKVALILYRVPLENLKIDPVVVSGSQTSAASVQLLGRTSADDRGAIKLLFNFKPAGLAAGEHELRFTIRQNDGTESVVTLPIRVL